MIKKHSFTVFVLINCFIHTPLFAQLASSSSSSCADGTFAFTTMGTSTCTQSLYYYQVLGDRECGKYCKKQSTSEYECQKKSFGAVKCSPHHVGTYKASATEEPVALTGRAHVGDVLRTHVTNLGDQVEAETHHAPCECELKKDDKDDEPTFGPGFDSSYPSQLVDEYQLENYYYNDSVYSY